MLCSYRCLHWIAKRYIWEMLSCCVSMAVMNLSMWLASDERELNRMISRSRPCRKQVKFHSLTWSYSYERNTLCLAAFPFLFIFHRLFLQPNLFSYRISLEMNTVRFPCKNEHCLWVHGVRMSISRSNEPKIGRNHTNKWTRTIFPLSLQPPSDWTSAIFDRWFWLLFTYSTKQNIVLRLENSVFFTCNFLI